MPSGFKISSFLEAIIKQLAKFSLLFYRLEKNAKTQVLSVW